MTSRLLTLLAALGLLLLLPPAGLDAQQHTGNLYGTVLNAEGAPVPGALVTLRGPGGPMAQVTNEEGGFRFLDLSAGIYGLQVEADAFQPLAVNRIQVQTGRNTILEAALNTTAPVDPASEPSTTGGRGWRPTYGEPRNLASQVIDQRAVETLPLARDFASMATLLPGVLRSNVNVGGASTLDPAAYVATGTSLDSTEYRLEGVRLTDLSLIGKTPSYYNFEAFGQERVSVGGSDAATATGGLTTSVVSRSGTNMSRGFAQFDFLNGSAFTDKMFQPRDGRFNSGLDVSGGYGGPISRNRLWYFAAGGNHSTGRTNFAADGETPGDMSAGTYLGKVTWARGPNRLNAFLAGSSFERLGRGAGRNAETTWRESGPTNIFKIDNAYTFNSNLFLTGLYSYVKGGFELNPLGTGTPVQIDDLPYTGGYWAADTKRSATQLTLGATWFPRFGRGSELNIGFERYRFGDGTNAFWPTGTLTFRASGFPEPIAVFPPEHVSEVTANNTSVWAQYTKRDDRFTLSGGLRFDTWRSENQPSTLLPNPLRPTGAPGGDYPGSEFDLTWSNMSPRLGFTYELTPRKRLYTSFGRYATPLPTWLARLGSPIDQFDPFRFSEFFFYQDLIPNDTYNATEPKGGSDHVGGFPASSPFAFLSPTLLVEDLKAPTQTDFTVGMQVRTRRNSLVRLEYNYRSNTNLTDEVPFVTDGVTTRPIEFADWVTGPILTGPDLEGDPVQIQTFQLNPALAFTEDTLLTTLGRSQSANSVTVSYDSKWSKYCGVSSYVRFNSWTQHVPVEARRNPNDLVGPDDNDGAPAAVRLSDTYLNAQWQAEVRGYLMVARETPAAVTVSGRWSSQGGYLIEPYLNIDAGGIDQAIAAGTFGDQRLESTRQLDLRVAKDLRFNDVGLTVAVDMFNLMNRQTAQEIESDLEAENAGDPVRRITPRVLRFGVQVTF